MNITNLNFQPRIAQRNYNQNTTTTNPQTSHLLNNNTNDTFVKTTPVKHSQVSFCGTEGILKRLSDRLAGIPKSINIDKLPSSSIPDFAKAWMKKFGITNVCKGGDWLSTNTIPTEGNGKYNYVNHNYVNHLTRKSKRHYSGAVYDNGHLTTLYDENGIRRLRFDWNDDEKEITIEEWDKNGRKLYKFTKNPEKNLNVLKIYKPNQNKDDIFLDKSIVINAHEGKLTYSDTEFGPFIDNGKKYYMTYVKDGKKLYYTMENDQPKIVHLTMSFDGENIESVISRPAQKTHPKWSDQYDIRVNETLNDPGYTLSLNPKNFNEVDFPKLFELEKFEPANIKLKCEVLKELEKEYGTACKNYKPVTDESIQNELNTNYTDIPIEKFFEEPSNKTVH